MAMFTGVVRNSRKDINLFDEGGSFREDEIVQQERQRIQNRNTTRNTNLFYQETSRRVEEMKKSSVANVESTLDIKSRLRAKVAESTISLPNLLLSSEDSEAQAAVEAHARRLSGLPFSSRVAIFRNDSGQWMIHPNSKVYMRWEVYKLALLLYVATVTPYQVSFDIKEGDHTLILDVVDIVVEMSFVLDMIMQFYLPVELKGREHSLWATEMGMVASMYFNSWFWLDCVSCFPYQVLLLCLKGVPTNLEVLRVLRVARIMKVFRMMRFGRFGDILMRACNYNDTILDLIKFAMTVLLVTHWMACGWRMLAGYVDEGGESWVTHTAFVHGESEWSLYMTSVYWAVVTFTTIGYGDVTPVSDNERAFTLCTAILGALLFGYMIGEICRLMSSFGHKQDLKFRTMAHLHNFTTERGLPRSLNQALTKFFLFKAECDDYDGSPKENWTTKTDSVAQALEAYHTSLGKVVYCSARETPQHVNKLVQEMSPTLRGQVLFHVHQLWLKRLPSWQSMVRGSSQTVDFFTLLHLELRTLAYCERETLVNAHEPLEELLVLERGLVLCDAKVMSSGDTIGLDMIKGECYWQHSAVTITCAVVHVLSRKSLLTILEVFPEVKATVARNSVRRKLLRALRLYIHQVQARLESLYVRADELWAHLLGPEDYQASRPFALLGTMFKFSESQNLGLIQPSYHLQTLTVSHALTMLRERQPAMYRALIRSLVKIQKMWRKKRRPRQMLKRYLQFNKKQLLLVQLLEKACLAEFTNKICLEEDMNIDSLEYISAGDLKLMGIPLGKAAGLMFAYKSYKESQQDHGNAVVDSASAKLVPSKDDSLVQIQSNVTSEAPSTSYRNDCHGIESPSSLMPKERKQLRFVVTDSDYFSSEEDTDDMGHASESRTTADTSVDPDNVRVELNRRIDGVGKHEVSAGEGSIAWTVHTPNVEALGQAMDEAHRHEVMEGVEGYSRMLSMRSKEAAL